ncbi:MAG: response regulator [Bacteroidota bacterium]
MNDAYGPILVVEDVPNILDLLEITLRFKGYRVMTARDGQQALERVAEEKPALIITDILMPTMDGYALVHRLRTNPETVNIPVIFLTATYVTPEDKAFGMSLGASRFIEKPIDTDDFLTTVAQLLAEGPIPTPPALAQQDFYVGYRARLENKLWHKRRQIARAQALLPSLPPDQHEAYELLLEQSIRDRDEIQAELDEVYRSIDQFNS